MIKLIVYTYLCPQKHKTQYGMYSGTAPQTVVCQHGWDVQCENEGCYERAKLIRKETIKVKEIPEND